MAWATSTELPTESALKAEMTKNMSWMAAPTPASAAGPSWATMMVSTMPNRVCKKFSLMTGQARVMTRRRMAAWLGAGKLTGATPAVST